MNIYKIAILAFFGLNLPVFGMTEFTHQAVARQANRMAHLVKNTIQKNTKKIAVAVGAAVMYEAQDDIRLAAFNHGQEWQKKYPQAFQTFVTNPLLKRIHYKSMDEYLKESGRETTKRQNIARTLAEKGVPLDLSQTEADMLTYESPKHKKDVVEHYNNLATRSLFSKKTNTLNTMFASEKSANQQDLVVLYHAMPRSFYGLNYIGTRLDQISSKSVNPDYLELRQPIKDQPKWNQQQGWKDAVQSLLGYGKNDTEQDNVVREMLLNQEGQNSYEKSDKILGLGNDHHPVINRYLISANPSIASNSYSSEVHPGESSLYYWANHGPQSLHLSDNTALKSLFDAKKISAHLYEKYQEKFNKVYADFVINSGDQGEVMLQLIMSPTLLDETTYPAHPYGLKRNIYYKNQIYEQLLDRQHAIDSSSKVLTEFKRNPFNIYFHMSPKECWSTGIDRAQFRVIADKSRLLDHKNKDITDNFSVKAYMGNQSHLTKFRTEIDQIMKDLAEDLKK